MRRHLAPWLLLLTLAWPVHAQQHEHPAPEAPGQAAELDPPIAGVLERQLDAVRAAVARYEDHDAAVADGYRRFGRGLEGSSLMGEHWYREDRVRAPLDLERPSTLIYAQVGGERRLVAVAYTVYQRPGEPLPEGFAGDADHWHVHHVDALARALVADRPLLRALLERRIASGAVGAGEGRSDLVMLHVWTGMENPDGVFANRNVALPYVRAGLPAGWARAGDPAPAQGVGLLLPKACGGSSRQARGLAGMDAEQADAIAAACGSAAAAVRDAANETWEGRLDPDAFNAAAARAWRGYAATVMASLSPEQRSRLAALGAATIH